jgi:tetratricopeptide (TPR) repeat protein
MATELDKREIVMRVKCLFAVLSLSALLPGCAAIKGSSDVAQGREALFVGDYPAALSDFQSAEQLYPQYVFGELREGVPSYLGRAQYLNGEYTQARQTLEKALVQDKDDNVARLYLGLTLARLGERQNALQDIDAGMKGIHESLDYISDHFRFTYGQLWDPGRDIRSTIEEDRAMIASGKIDWPQLLSEGESVAMKMEREHDIVRREQENHFRLVP